jgi:hypothetical protein
MSLLPSDLDNDVGLVAATASRADALGQMTEFTPTELPADLDCDVDLIAAAASRGGALGLAADVTPTVTRGARPLLAESAAYIGVMGIARAMVPLPPSDVPFMGDQPRSRRPCS